MIKNLFSILLAAGLFSSCRSTAQIIELAFPNLTFNQPVYLTHANDNSNRLFVIEQPGVIRWFNNNQNTNSSTVFLDINTKVEYGGEQGLLGLAFHPDFKNNGFFYVNYTTTEAGKLQTRVSRFKTSDNTHTAADPNSELVLLEFDQPFTNHNGGIVDFGDDGYLYIGTGDGGSGGDPLNNGQSLTTLLGKILRIDVNSTTTGKNYGIPADNPFVSGTNGELPEIYAYGLRNPWRFSRDVQSGDIWIADVGQNAIEEIDLLQKGGNYGWRIMEGNSCYNPAVNCNTAGLITPVFEYQHQDGNCSITGGYVYRGTNIPTLQGYYIYGDYCTGNVWGFNYVNGAVTDNHLIADTDLSISSFGADQNNEIYILNHQIGNIFKLNADPSAIKKNQESELSYWFTRETMEVRLEEKGSISIFNVAGQQLFHQKGLSEYSISRQILPKQYITVVETTKRKLRKKIQLN